MLVACDVDCGEVLPGHRLLIHGLRHDGYSDDDRNGEYMDHYSGKPVHPVVSLVYALVPGLPEPEQHGHLDIDMTVVLDPHPDPAIWGRVLTMGSERDVETGGAETLGAVGPFVFPEATRRVSAAVSQIFVVDAAAQSLPADVSPAGLLGTVDIDVPTGTGRWNAA